MALRSVFSVAGREQAADGHSTARRSLEHLYVLGHSRPSNVLNWVD